MNDLNFNFSVCVEIQSWPSFSRFVFFRPISENHFSRKRTTTTTRQHDDNTETPDPVQTQIPSHPGIKYLVRGIPPSDNELSDQMLTLNTTESITCHITMYFLMLLFLDLYSVRGRDRASHAHETRARIASTLFLQQTVTGARARPSLYWSTQVPRVIAKTPSV